MEQNNRTMEEEKGWEKVSWDPVTSENQGATKEESNPILPKYHWSLDFHFCCVYFVLLFLNVIFSVQSNGKVLCK